MKLAMDLHLTQNSISRYENNQRETDHETLIRIADYFDVSLDELLECDYPPGGSKQNKP